jgi:hypothetical protein
MKKVKKLKKNPGLKTTDRTKRTGTAARNEKGNCRFGRYLRSGAWGAGSYKSSKEIS